jgi:uncharacterized protein (UPF0261 family)
MTDDRFLTPARVVLAGSLDTKGDEYGYVRDRLASAGIPSLIVDTGVLGVPTLAADITRADVARAGGADLETLAKSGDRSEAMIAMAHGAARTILALHEKGAVSAVMVLGGSNAGFVMGRIASALPIGVPKILVSTIVAGDTRPYVGTSDLTMMYPVVDIAGLNSISIPVLSRAADAAAGMIGGAPIVSIQTAGATVACTMFGVTTNCVTAVHDAIVAQGSEVHTFHANGTGGRTLEAMIRSGLFDAVADITTTELADELCGGVCSAGPERLDAAAQSGVPQVVSLGALDMVNFGAPDTVPEKYRRRLLYPHNPAVTLMRTDAAECAELGRIIAGKLNTATAFTEVLAPARGFSQISVEGAPFFDPAADAALIDSLREHLQAHVPLRVIDAAINDPDFSSEVIDALGRALGHTKGSNA